MAKKHAYEVFFSLKCSNLSYAQKVFDNLSFCFPASNVYLWDGNTVILRKRYKGSN